MRRIVLIGLLWAAVLLPSWATAQLTAAVDYHTQTICWDWVRGAPPDDGIPTRFHVKCGPKKGTYTYPLAPVAMPNKCILIKDAVPTQGEGYCVIASANDHGESLKTSNEVFFVAGARPAAPSNARLE